MAIFMTQYWLPLNPQKLANCSWHLAFMQGWSFACNADWQSYSGESTMSYFSQVVGIMVHQFLSGAVGLAVLVAVGRALARHTMRTIGNFWVDLTRCILYIVLPLAALWAIPLAWQGCPQTWKAYADAKLTEPYTSQVPTNDASGNPIMTNIAVTVQTPQLDAKGQQVLSNNVVVMADTPKLDEKGQPLTTNVPVMVNQLVTTQSIPVGQTTFHQRWRLVRHQQRASV